MGMSQHFVSFYSPGTFFAEETTREIDAWDVDAAAAMADAIVERYEARPYGFRFSTRARDDDQLDSRVVTKSAMYYLGGKIETLAEIEARNDPEERVLRENMRGNGWDRIVTGNNPWRWSQPLGPNDVVLSEETAKP